MTAMSGTGLTTIPGALGDVRLGADGWLTWDDAAEAVAAQRAQAQLMRAGDGIPKLRADGLLPVGIHQAELGEVVSRFGHGPRRWQLMERLADVLPRLQQAGVSDVVIGGSLVSSKQAPHDIDLAWFGLDDAVVGARVNAVKKSLPDGVGLFQGRGIVGNAPSLQGTTPGETFLELFQHDRAGVRRGVVRVPTWSFDDGVRAIGRGTQVLDGGGGLDDAMRAVRALLPRA